MFDSPSAASLYDRYRELLFEGAPEFIVEVLSDETARIDPIRKAALYMNSGVKEYWIVEPGLKRILVHLVGASYLAPRTVLAGTLTSAVIPEFTIDLNAIFAPVLETFD